MFLWNFFNIHYIMQKILYVLSKISLVIVEKNISIQKKDTWTISTFHEHCNYLSVGGFHLILPIIISILLQILWEMYWYYKKIDSRPNNIRKYFVKSFKIFQISIYTTIFIINWIFLKKQNIEIILVSFIHGIYFI